MSLRTELDRYAPTLEDKAEVMAIGLVMDRVVRIDAESREDLFELMKEYPNATSFEEKQAITLTMLELLDPKGSQGKLIPLDLAASRGEKDSLAKWVKPLGERIKKAREAKGMTQEDLCKMTGLPQSHISRIERGHLSPSSLTIEKIAKALGVSNCDIDLTD